MFGLSTKALVNWLIEFGPIWVFALSFGTLGFFRATGLLVILTALGLVYAIVVAKRIPIFPLVAGTLIIAFGIATIRFHDPHFLALEYTLYNGVLGLIVLGGLFFDRIILKYMFESLLALSERGWKILSFHWGLWLLLTAFLNEIVWISSSRETWVYFRASLVILTFLFALTQFPMGRRERLLEASYWGFRK